MVCPNGKSELRAIHGTLSSAKLYAVAWATEDGSTGSDYELMAHDDYKARFAGSDRPTFLVRLGDGKVLAELKGSHLGDQARYNHRVGARSGHRTKAGWPRFMIRKWSTENAAIYRIGAAGTLQSLDLLKLCRTAEKELFQAHVDQAQIRQLRAKCRHQSR